MLTRYDPWTSAHHLRDEINRVFGPARVEADDSLNVVTSRWMPAVDVKELEDRFVIAADLPGIDPNDIEITMDSGTLSIKGERTHAEATDEKTGYRRVERSYGSFYRRFTLPDTADAQKVSASGSHGVLEIEIMKKLADQPQRIKVETQSS